MGKTHVNISIEIENVYLWFEKLTSGDTEARIVMPLQLALVWIVTLQTLKVLVLCHQWPSWGKVRSYLWSDPQSQMHCLKVQVLIPYDIDEILNWSCHIFITLSYTTYLPPHWLALPQETTNAMYVFITSPVIENRRFLECPNSSGSPHATWLWNFKLLPESQQWFFCKSQRYCCMLHKEVSTSDYPFLDSYCSELLDPGFPCLLLLLSYCFFLSMVLCLDFYFPKQSYKVEVCETLLKTWDINTATIMINNNSNNTANFKLCIRHDCFPNTLAKEPHTFSKEVSLP